MDKRPGSRKDAATNGDHGEVAMIDAKAGAAHPRTFAPAKLRVNFRTSRGDQNGSSIVDGGDSSAWAVPYTDLTMLLMVFFIVMLSRAGPPASITETFRTTPDPSAEWAAGPSSRSDRHSHLVLQRGKGILEGGAHQNDAPPESNDEFMAEWKRRVQALEAKAARFLLDANLSNQVSLTANETGIELRMSDDVLFSSGSATIEASGVELMARLSPLLKDIKGRIQISGHTDNRPIRTARFPSNWELSAARAIAVVRALGAWAVPEARMQAIGHGANRPVAPNDSAAGRAANRRVTIEVSPVPHSG